MKFLFFSFSAILSAVDYPVTAIADNGSGSLREALLLAISNDTISFQSGLIGIIQLQSPLPIIDTDLTITGNDNVSISGENQHQVFFANSGNVSISNLSIENGKSKGGDGGTMVIGGDYTQGGGSILTVDIDSSGASDLLDIGGVALVPLSGDEITANFVGFSETFTVKTTDDTIYSIVPSTRVSWLVCNGMCLTLFYRGEFSGKRCEQNINVDLSWNF